MHATASTEKEKSDDDERFLRELRAVYAAPDRDAVRAVLPAVVMPAEFSAETVGDYVLAFTKAVKAK